jgi:hypothetical protein
MPWAGTENAINAQWGACSPGGAQAARRRDDLARVRDEMTASPDEIKGGVRDETSWSDLCVLSLDVRYSPKLTARSGR